MSLCRPECVCVLCRCAALSVLQHGFLTDLRWGVHRALCAPYQPRLYFWESVLMTQRLVLAAVSVFLSSSRPTVAVQVAVTLVSFFLRNNWPLHLRGTHDVDVTQKLGVG